MGGRWTVWPCSLLARAVSRSCWLCRRRKGERGRHKRRHAWPLYGWSPRPHIQGLVFDTTASNTGIHRGACTLIEEGLGRELVWTACRHHVLEIVLSSVFKVVFGPTGGPENGLFKRFMMKWWPNVNQEVYVGAPSEMFRDHRLEEQRIDMVSYIQQAMKEQQVRADYAEFLSLSLLFLGGGGDQRAKFRPPGPTHHARWMGKGLYVLKIFLFRDQFRLTAKESRPRNDSDFLQALRAYPNKEVADAAITAFARHLWYLAEHLNGLAFFDEDVDVATKRKMVTNLEREKKPGCPRRLQGVPEIGVELDAFVTKRTLKMFSVIAEQGMVKVKSSFLKEDPGTWETNLVMKKSAGSLKVVNDAAERAVSLVQTFNASLNKDEEQKQFLLRLVAEKPPPCSDQGGTDERGMLLNCRAFLLIQLFCFHGK
ncbi:hypothetical protein GWK47_035034 [Chionoecetes opilio]|uniref:Uncharacterized protein n=1 Tax=Chionoecetes opilio TaxID=41210 RepID=A0A8J4YUG3_CHIOP|nr:hypothetical protein GWK47_035034 [Chionoecetes opilio]